MANAHACRVRRDRFEYPVSVLLQRTARNELDELHAMRSHMRDEGQVQVAPALVGALDRNGQVCFAPLRQINAESTAGAQQAASRNPDRELFGDMSLLG